MNRADQIFETGAAKANVRAPVGGGFVGFLMIDVI